jgi:hypothetical protein
MVGSPLIAAWIARVAFWCLIPWGVVSGELGVRSCVIFLAVWTAAFVGFDYLPVPYSGMFPSFVALLDVVLVLIIVKGDVRIT